MIKEKVLIVGGAGFVGSNLSHHLLDKHRPKELWIVDNLLSSETINIPRDSRVNFIFGSIADPNILSRLPDDLEIVFHLACYHGNQSSIYDPIEDHKNNSLTSLMLFNHLINLKNLKKVVYAAAGCAVAEKTYGNPQATPENAPVSLFHDSPYSISKLIGEMYGNYYWVRSGLPFIKARFQNVYGPREILGAGSWRGTKHTVWRNVIPSFIWKSLSKEALPLDCEGKTSRDFIFVDDMVKGLVACAETGINGEAYNLASGVETTIKEIADTINKITGNDTPVDLLSARDWDNSGRRFGSTKKSEKELQFKASVSIEEGLAATVAWTKKNQELIERNIQKHDVSMGQLGD